jgi:hypothetical protein
MFDPMPFAATICAMFKHPDAMDEGEFDEAARQAAVEVISRKIVHDRRFGYFASFALVLGAAGFGGAGSAIMNAMQLPNPLAVDSCFTSLAAAILRRAKKGDKVTNDMRLAIEQFPDQTLQVIVDAIGAAQNEMEKENLLSFLAIWFPNYVYADPRVLEEQYGTVHIPHYDTFNPLASKGAA